MPRPDLLRQAGPVKQWLRRRIGVGLDRSEPTMTTRTLLAAATLAAGLADAAAAAPLADYRWSHRVVVLFAPTETTTLVEQTKDLLADKTGLAERDLVVLAVVGDEAPRLLFGQAPRDTPTAAALRQAYDVAEPIGFTAILVGKDGGEKLRQTHPVRRDQLYGTIDAMPMRRGEAAAQPR
jgi:hypothetical protein